MLKSLIQNVWLRFSSKYGFLFYPIKNDFEAKKYRIIDTDNYLIEYPFIIPMEQKKIYSDYYLEISREENRFKNQIQELIKES